MLLLHTQTHVDSETFGLYSLRVAKQALERYV